MNDERRLLTVYTAPGCCLCDDAAEVLRPLALELDLEVQWIDISRDPELEARYRESIPRGELDGRTVFKFTVDEQLLRRRCMS